MDEVFPESMEDIGLHDHACAFHKSPEERLAALVPYFRAGLSRGEKCLILCAEADGEEILRGLRTKGIDVGNALARGAMLVTQGPRVKPGKAAADPVSLVEFYRSIARTAATERHSGLRLCVDMASAVGRDVPRDRLVKYQESLHDFLAGENALCLCLHGIGEFSAETLLDALRAHPIVVVEGKAAGNFYFIPPSEGSGKIDASALLDRRLAHIMEQRRRMARLRRQTMRLTRLRDISASLLDHASISDLLNRIVEGVASLGYRMSWIGMARPDGSVETAAVCGDKEGHLHRFPTRWDGGPPGDGPAGTAIRKGKTEIVRDTARSQRFAAWRAAAAAAGYLSAASIPIREGENVVGALTAYAGERDAFDREAIEELQAFALQASLVRQRTREYRNMARAQKMEAMGAIAGGMAHEYNNILSSIIGYASLLQARMTPDDPDRAMILKIRLSAERAADLTSNLMGFARRGKQQVRTFTFNDLVMDALPLLSDGIGPSIDIRTLLDPSNPPIHGDEGQLKRSLLDLCFNARDAMPGGGTISIRTGSERLSAEEADRYHAGRAGDYSILEVSDTGTGMTEDVRKRIFEPFFTTKSSKGHTGMGLPSVYGIVKNHSGCIHVESTPGKGSTFRIYLPSAARSREERPPAQAEQPAPGGTETILVVDDEPEIREVGSALLSALGYKTIVAASGEEALRIFGESGGEIRLVLLDVIMPGMGGREAFRALRKLSPGLPVLISSGYAVEGLASEILDEGANGFIRKPYGMSELARMVRRILDRISHLGS